MSRSRGKGTFHVFGVYLGDYTEQETPRVRYVDYYVQAATIKGAFAVVEPYLVDAVEVWLSEIVGAVIITPSTVLNATDDLERHTRLFNVKPRLHAPTGYKLMKQGPDALATLIALRRTEHATDRVAAESDAAREFAQRFGA